MSSVPHAIEGLVGGAQSRMALTVRLARSAWLGLAALLSVEAGALAARGLGEGAFEAGIGIALLLALAALASLVLGGRPTRNQAAVQLDRALGRGALLETALEALEGKHGPLGALVVAEAARETEGAELARLAPVSAPRGFAAAAAGALLLLAVVLGPAAEPARAEARVPTIVLGGDSSSSSASSSSKPESSSKARPSSPETVLVTPENATGGAKPGSRFSPEVESALEERLSALAQALAARAAKPQEPGKALAPSDEKTTGDALDRALASGDQKVALEALAKLEERGTVLSLETVKKARDTLAGSSKRPSSRSGAGAGSGKEASPTAGATHTATAPETVPGPDRDPGRESGTTVPYRVRLAEARYLAALEAQGGP